MPSRRFVLDAPDRFVPDAVGLPGRRTFYLQVRQGRATVSVALEKVQLQVLAERLAMLLDEVERRGLADTHDDSASAAGAADDGAPLDQPVVPLFRVGAMVLAWRGDEHRVTVETRAETDVELDDESDEVAGAEAIGDGGDLVRVSLTPAMARAFIQRAARVIAAGRPPCPACGMPLEATGHICRPRGAYLN